VSQDKPHLFHKRQTAATVTYLWPKLLTVWLRPSLLSTLPCPLHCVTPISLSILCRLASDIHSQLSCSVSKQCIILIKVRSVSKFMPFEQCHPTPLDPLVVTFMSLFSYFPSFLHQIQQVQACDQLKSKIQMDIAKVLRLYKQWTKFYYHQWWEWRSAGCPLSFNAVVYLQLLKCNQSECTSSCQKSKSVYECCNVGQLDLLTWKHLQL